MVFGAGGPLGAAIVRRLADRGSRVRAVVRDPERSPFPCDVEVFCGDPAYRRNALEAAEGASVVYRCVPVRLSLWCDVWVSATTNILAAAAAAGAKLVSPGNVYVYGPPQRLPVDESHPLAARGEKGRIRVETQSLLVKAHADGRVAVVIPRFPDTFGPGVRTPAMGALFANAAAGRAVHWFGDPKIMHDFLFIEDAAAAAVALGEREEAYGQVWHVPGPGGMPVIDFLRLVYERAGSRLRLRRLSPSQVRVEALLDEETSSFLEFRYLYEQDHVLDGSRFARAFPDFAYTPHADAVDATLAWFAARV